MKKQLVPNPEDPQTLLRAAFARTGITVYCARPHLCSEAATSPGGKPWMHFEYLFTFSHNGRAISPPTYCAGADENEIKRRKPSADKRPDPAEVLGRFCVDAREAYGSTYPTWAVAFCYTVDSIRAREVYDRCVRLYSDLCWILSPEQISELADLASAL